MPFIFYSTKSSLHNKKLDFRSTIKKVCLSKNQVSEIYLARVGLKEATFEYLAHDNNLAPTLQLQWRFKASIPDYIQWSHVVSKLQTWIWWSRNPYRNDLLENFSLLNCNCYFSSQVTRYGWFLMDQSTLSGLRIWTLSWTTTRL